MSRLWAVLVGVLATLTMAGVAPTTTASAAPFVYDAPALARVDAHVSGLAEAGQRAPIGAQEGSVLPWVEARGTATTPFTRSIATEAAGVEGGLPKLGAEPNFQNPAEAPGSGWEWRGNGDPGSSKGSWYNPESGESLHPDLGHPDPIGPHYDWKAPNGVTYRVYPDGTVVEK